MPSLLELFADQIGVDRTKLRRLSELRIGQRVKFISRDAGIPDSIETITGINIQAFKHGREDITLTDDQGSTADGYTLEDIIESFAG